MFESNIELLRIVLPCFIPNIGRFDISCASAEYSTKDIEAMSEPNTTPLSVLLNDYHIRGSSYAESKDW
jgi:hypothetical protein